MLKGCLLGVDRLGIVFILVINGLSLINISMTMRIIRIEAETIVDGSLQFLKFAIGLDGKRHRKVGKFVAYVKKICKLENVSYQLLFDGFVIPNSDRTKGLQESHIYRLRMERNWNEYQSRASQVESEGEEAANERRSRNEKGGERKSKKEQKLAKIGRKKKESSSSSSESDDESISSSSSSDSSSSSLSSLSEESSLVEKYKKILAKKRAVAPNDETPKETVKVKQNASVPAKRPIEKPKKQVQQVPVIQQEDSPLSSSSSSESEEELPKVKETKPNPPAKTASKTITQVVVREQKHENVLRSQPKKKAVIEDSSSSQSQPSDYEPMKKRPQPPSSKNNEEATITLPQTATAQKPKYQGKIPPALRNKFVKKNFDQHKENQWINVQKESLKKWQEKGNKNVCHPNNKIRFKVVQLDEEKFIPVKSGWINAEVKSVNAETGVVTLSKVEQEGKPYRQIFEIPEHNMDELQINKLLATKEQIQCFEAQPIETPAQPPKQIKQQSVQPFQAPNGKNSLQKYICGQVNYYFSDKNYNFDLFMQMHANRHPQKYLNLGIMLNFGKIKKFLNNQAKLIEFLKEDEKYEQRTYEIDFENKLIRKKGIKIEPKQPQPEQQQGQQAPFAGSM